ncbi:MAG: glycosyltransferase family 4 protein, partial [Pyrinomonadaceae bacterium]
MRLEGRRALFISYNGMLEPLGQSQVIPYLRELSQEGVRFTLLSFERSNAFEPQGRAKCDALREELAGQGIEWHWLRYHQRPSVPATFYDVVAGVRYAQRLMKRNKIELVHARSHIPATMALVLKRRFGVKMIFDVRGLMAEEYVDAEHWREGNIPYRLTKRMERRAFLAADGVVTLTERIWPIIRDWPGLRGRTVAHEVIPCCADLTRFKFDEAARRDVRAELRLQDKLVVVYSGSIGGWYSTEELADFFCALLKVRPDAHFLCLTRGPHELIERLMRERNIADEKYSVRAVAPADVPSYLSASDAGIAFYKPSLSRLATSPVKVAEYLACGLPVIINAGVGDCDTLIARENVGALVQDFNKAEYAKAASTINGLLSDAPKTRQHTRAVAERLFDVRTLGRERYTRLYEK